MSNTQPALPSLSIPPAYPFYPSSPHSYSYSSSVSLPSLSTWGAFTPSSPPRSSSPSPMTPSKEREREFSTCLCPAVGVRSSPGLGLEIGRKVESDDDVDEAWGGDDARTSLPGIKSLFAQELRTTHLGASKSDASHLQSRSCRQLSNFTDYTRDGCAYPHADEYIDSEDDTHDDNDNEDDESEGLSFTDLDTRATFFRISAERGRWRYEPPLHLPHSQRPLALHRQSTPMASPPPILGLTVPQRPISEPLPSTSTPPPLHEEERGEHGPDILSSAIEAANIGASSDPGSADARMDIRVYSPLPPSSPPLSSSPALLGRSISPLSFAPSSPRLPPSSPLSFFDSLPPSSSEEQEVELDTKNVNADVDVPVRDRDDEKLTFDASSDVAEQLDPVHEQRGAKREQDPEQTPTFELPEDLPAHSEICVESDTLDASSRQQGSALGPLSEEYMSSHGSCMDVGEKDAPLPSFSMGDDADNAVAAAVAVAKQLFGDEEDIGISEMEMDGSGSGSGLDEDLDEGLGEVSSFSLSSSPGWEEEGRVKFKLKDGECAVGALRTKDENGVGVDVDKAGLVRKEKRKKEKQNAREGDGLPPRKKARVDSGVEMRKAKKEVKRRSGEDHEEENRPAPKQKRQKKAGSDGLTSQKRLARLETSGSSSSGSKSTSKHQHQTPTSVSTSFSSSESRCLDETKARLKTPPRPPPLVPKDPETEALHAEIRGMIIESMATSRASCLPASALYKSAMQCRPSLGAQRSEKEWMEIIESVLREGEAARGGCGVFGKVESSFKDESGRPLEAQWFYVPEMDEDQERAALIRSMMPRPAKRSVTKKYKQYYYRPLAKITRWDPEDDL